jgi:hypothetical protein
VPISAARMTTTSFRRTRAFPNPVFRH